MAKSLNVQILGKLLQNHLNLLDEYFLEYGLKVNVDKCQATLFTRKLKIIPPKITLSNRELVWTRQTKYLGVTLDKNLSFRPHIKNINSKAVGRMKSIIPLLLHRAITEKSKLLIYTSIVRPIITYASPAWSTLPRTGYRKLQILQNRALRLITKLPRYTRITQLHDITGIPTIQEHTQRLNQSFYSKLKSNPFKNPTLNTFLTTKCSLGKRKRPTTQLALDGLTSGGPKRPRH